MLGKIICLLITLLQLNELLECLSFYLFMNFRVWNYIVFSFNKYLKIFGWIPKYLFGFLEQLFPV